MASFPVTPGLRELIDYDNGTRKKKTVTYTHDVANVFFEQMKNHPRFALTRAAREPTASARWSGLSGHCRELASSVSLAIS